MLRLRFFLLMLVGATLLSACWKGSLTGGHAGTAPDNDELSVWDEQEASPLGEPSIWDIAKRHGSFTTFSQLVEIAELEETFKSDEVITVLAPTDEAFNQLPDGIIKQLLEKENETALIEMLLDHVIPDVYLSADLMDGETAPTLAGNNLIISRDEELKLGNATVTTADIGARNGVVHVVDQVIIIQP